MSWFHQKRLVRIQHKDLDQEALEGIWVGMVDGHYHLVAPRLVREHVKTQLQGDIFIPKGSVLFLESIAADAS